MEAIDRSIIGKSTGKETFTYTWRDLAIYAVGVGAKVDDLQYQYEKYLKAIPTYAAVPYWGTFGIEPHRDMPSNIAFTSGLDLRKTIHMAHEVIIHKPLNPKGDTLTIEDTITELYDRGGKYTVMRTELVGYDQNGEKVFTNIGDVMFGMYSAEGSPQYPKPEVVIPEREPDVVVDDYCAENQHLLYRLSGDTNLAHVDPDFAKASGFSGPIMQGLCSFGFAARMAISKICPEEPEKLMSVGAQLRGLLMPGTPVRLQLWKIDEKTSYFRLINPEDGALVLERGKMTWR